MTIAIVHGGPLLRITESWWPVLDEIVAKHGITEIWHGAHVDARHELAGSDAAIDTWARRSCLQVKIFPIPHGVYESAGVDTAKAPTRRIKDWLGGHRQYVVDGKSGKESSVKTTETVGLPHLVISLPGDTWTSLLAVEARRAHLQVETVAMVREPGLPLVINGHHHRALGATDGPDVGGKVDRRPPLPEPWIYIGRACAGHASSALANPFTKQDHGDAAIPLYKRHLWAKMKAQDPAVLRALDEITPEHHLVCWCLLPNGYGQCHGQIVVAAWDWLRNEGT